MLGGCGSTVRSNVITFHELAPNTRLSFTVRPYQDQQESLEYRTYADLIKRNLEAKGFREVRIEQADLIVLFRYGIGEGNTTAERYPRIGQLNGSEENVSADIAISSAKAEKKMRMRFLRLEMIDAGALRAAGNILQLYDTRVTSRGKVAQLPAVVPSMVKSIFEDFPGKSGSIRKSTVLLVKE
jgi:hypothetical protein